MNHGLLGALRTISESWQKHERTQQCVRSLCLQRLNTFRSQTGISSRAAPCPWRRLPEIDTLGAACNKGFGGRQITYLNSMYSILLCCKELSSIAKNFGELRVHAHVSDYLPIYLPTCLSICLPIYPSMYLSSHLSFYPAVYLPFCWSNCLSTHLFIYPSVHPSVCLSIELTVYRPVYQSLNLPILHICLSIYLPIYLPVVCIHIRCMQLRTCLHTVWLQVHSFLSSPIHGNLKRAAYEKAPLLVTC